MIIPVSNVIFKDIKKINKTAKKTQVSPNFQDNDYKNNLSNLNFTGYYKMKKVEPVFEYGLKNNFFELPKITDKNGEEIQLQPDKSQLRCAKLLCDGKNVVFDAPTGMGKTSVAHFAMNKNFYEGRKSIYTVPIKALADDKFVEFSKIYGEENVGILTGDRKINSNAPIVIMTTEIFDNQAQTLADSDASRVGTVIYDEAHYIGDDERGIAWENSIINAATKGLQILCLSATIGNADEFTNWIASLSKDRQTARVEVPAGQRPVPLVWHLYERNEEEEKLTQIVGGEVDLSLYFEDKISDIQKIIFDCEEAYWMNVRQLKIDPVFIHLIPEKFEQTFGKDWRYVDFDLDENREKLRQRFSSLTPLELNQISALAKMSGSAILTDRQRLALEVLYKTEYDMDSDYKMKEDDYSFIYSQLKSAIGEGQNNFKHSTKDFKRKLAQQFPSLDKVQLDQVTQLMAKDNVKNVKFIHQNWSPDNFISLVENLEQKEMLPAIIFKLSQGACEQVAKNLAHENEDELSDEEIENLEIQSQELDLLTQEEKEEVQKIIDKYENAGIYLGKNPQKDMLLRGWAVHHAGRLSQYKELVEELFSKKLLKVVVATSTLGAGINMPARTVVMTNTAYQRYDVDKEEYVHTPLTSNEFHQMSGRAGRRGIDSVGHVVLYNLHTPADRFRKDGEKDKNGKLDELWLAYDLINSGADDVRSSFRPQPASLAQYFSQNHKLEDIQELINDSFKVHLAKDKQKVANQMYKKFENFAQVLIKQGCLMRNHKKEMILTPKGEILAQAQGLNPLMLTTLLYDEKLAKLNPNQLAQVVAHIQGSSPEVEMDAQSSLVSSKIKYFSTLIDEINAIEFEQTKGLFKQTEQSVLKSLKEANVNRSDIKTTDSFSGLVGYMFASLNQIEGSNSIENFEKISKTIDVVPSSDSEINRDYARKATEGNIYKIIAGSISTLKQIVRICDFAIGYEDYYPNTSYWENLRENAQEAIKLLDRKPIISESDYEN